MSATSSNHTSVSFFKKLKSRPQYQRAFLYFVITYACYALLVGVLAPSMLKRAIPDQLEQLTGRKASIDNVSFNPFLSRLTMTRFDIKKSQLSLVHPDTTQGFSGFTSLVVEVSFWHSLFNQAISIKNITLTKPYGFIALQRSSINSAQPHMLTFDNIVFNFSDILRKIADNSAVASPNAENEQQTQIPHVLLDHLIIEQGDLRLYDTLTQTHLQYPKINIQLADFDTQALIKTQTATNPEAQLNRFSFQVTGTDKSEWQTQGQIQLTPLLVDAEHQLSRLQLTPFWPLVQQHIKAELKSGHISFSNRFTLKQNSKDLEFSLIDGLFVLENLKFKHEDTNLLSLPLLAIDNINLNSTGRQIQIAKLHTQGLVAELNIDKGGINLINLLSPDFMLKTSVSSHPQQYAQETKTTQQQEWLVTLNQTQVEDYTLLVTEQMATPNKWQLKDINIQSGKFISDLSQLLSYNLSMSINETTTLETQGKINLESHELTAGFTLNDFKLSQVQNYIAPYANILLEQGMLSTQGTMTTDKQGNIALTTELIVDNLDIKDKQLKEPLLQWDKLKVNKITYQGKDKLLSVDTIGLTKPYAKIIITEDRSTNIKQLVKTQNHSSSTNPDSDSIKDAVDKAKSQNAETSLALTVGKVLIDDGSVFFADNSLTPNFAASIEQLHGGVSKLSSLGTTKAKVDIKGKIDRYAPVILKGEINPLLDQPYLDLDLNFNNVELTSVNPYSGTYAGYYIDKGQLSLALNYQLEKNQLIGSNHLIIDQLELGKPSNSNLATSLPISLAIALLQDRHGVIDLGLDVSGDLDSPDFGIGSIVMTAITNVITKAVTSPFSLLASLIGSDEELDKLTYAPGSSMLAKPQQQKLSQLTKALAERPKLKLSVEGAIDIAKDTQALKSLQIAVQLSKLTPSIKLDAIKEMGVSTIASTPELSAALVDLYQKNLNLDPNEIKGNVLKKHEAKNANDEKALAITETQLDIEWKIALYNLTLNTEQVETDTLGQLAQRRAQNIKAFMVDELKSPPESIFIIDSRINTKQTGTLALLGLDVN